MKRDILLWIAILTGPIVWFLSFEANFAVSWWVCASGWKPAAFVVSLLALAITAGAGLLSWSQSRQIGPEQVRAHAMAMGGALLNAGFCLVLVAQALPHLLMNGCE